MAITHIVSGPTHDSRHLEHTDTFSGDVTRYDTGDEDNYSQVTDFWNKVRPILPITS